MSKTTHTHRELELLDAVRRFGGFARSSELASHLDVSEETVRRTIKALAKSGQMARVHGGAYLVGTQSDPSFFRRIAEDADEKRQIARAVAQQIADGMTVFLDVGSTTAFAAEELRGRRGLTIVTNSTQVAHTLVGQNGSRVFLLGGEMHADELGAFGFVTERQARRYVFDAVVLSADALSPRRGFLYANPAEAALASVVAGQADLRLMAMTHAKFGRAAPHRGFDAAVVDRLVVDAAPGPELGAQLRDWRVDVIVAAPDGRKRKGG